MRLMRILIVLLLSLLTSTAWAETKNISVVVDEVVGNNQSRDQMEAFALQKARREAVERAGVFVSAHTVVEKGIVSKDEVEVLTAGVIRSKTISSSSYLVGDVLHIKIAAQFTVDTTALDNLVESYAKDKKTLAKLRHQMGGASIRLLGYGISLNEAMQVAAEARKQFKSLKANLAEQYSIEKSTLETRYENLIKSSKLANPAPLKSRDVFESTKVYEARIEAHESMVRAVQAENEGVAAKLEKEKEIALAKLKMEYLKNGYITLRPFAQQLEVLRNMDFLGDRGQCKASLGTPDADKRIIPMTITCSGQKQDVDWSYANVNNARSVYQDQTHLVCRPIYRLVEEGPGIGKGLFGARVSHFPSRQEKEFIFKAGVPLFVEEQSLLATKNQQLPQAEKKLANTEKLGKKPEPGATWNDPATGMVFVWVPDGMFEMGSEDGDSDEKPVHKVTVDGFWMGKYEVTQAEWEKVMGNNPSNFRGSSNPVERVSWHDTQKFIKKVNSKDYGNFRLPTEAEWEYACRAGTSTKYYWDNSEDAAGNYAWYNKNSGGKAQQVGQKKPNKFGLYDMSGNVWEWCQDWYDDDYYSNSPQNNPKGPSGGEYRAFRGGSWYSGADGLRSARRSNTPVFRSSRMGFRLIKTN